jgi:hypothetical protein
MPLFSPSKISENSDRNQAMRANKVRYLMHHQQNQSPTRISTKRRSKSRRSTMSVRDKSGAANRQGMISPKSAVSNNDNIPRTSVNCPIKVCVRVRPILRPAENDCAWRVDHNNKSISSILQLDFDRESFDGSSTRFMQFAPHVRERELKRRFNEI